MKSFIALACLSSLLLASAPAAQAAAVTYTFSVAGVAVTGSGQFTFDGAAGSSNIFDDEVEYMLTEFSFNGPGGPFSIDDLDKNARSVLFNGAGDLLGLEAFSSSAGFSFLPAVGGSESFFMTTTASSTVTYRLDQNVVSEPGSALLGLAALAGLVAWRRRQMA